jgi:hypothetical protein
MAKSPKKTDDARRFPPERAFVVQLSAAEQRRKPTSGRVEHVVSGRCALFDSLERLAEFFGEVVAHATARGKPDEEQE